MIRKRVKKQQAGFSLIEVMVYVALTAAISVTLTSFMVDVIEHAAYVRQRQEIQHNANRLMAKLVSEVRNAKGVTVPYAKQMIIVRPDDTTARYRWNDDPSLMRVEVDTGAGYVAFSSSDVRVTNLAFNLVSTNPDEVSIVLDVEQKRVSPKPEEEYEISFESTAIRRRSIF